MNSKQVLERYKELNIDNNICCTEDELNDFLMCGILIKYNDKFITRNNDTIKVDVIKAKTKQLDINLSGIIHKATELSKAHNIKRIYFMTERCYNNYKEKGLIITKLEQDYYVSDVGENWLVYKM